jgi:hypothetical protein
MARWLGGAYIAWGLTTTTFCIWVRSWIWEWNAQWEFSSMRHWVSFIFNLSWTIYWWILGPCHNIVEKIMVEECNAWSKIKKINVVWVPTENVKGQKICRTSVETETLIQAVNFIFLLVHHNSWSWQWSNIITSIYFQRNSWSLRVSLSTALHNTGILIFNTMHHKYFQDHECVCQIKILPGILSERSELKIANGRSMN